MSFYTVGPSTADQVVSRLTPSLRCEILRASPDRLEYLRQTAFANEFATPEVMQEVAKKVHDHFVHMGNSHFGVFVNA